MLTMAFVLSLVITPGPGANKSPANSFKKNRSWAVYYMWKAHLYHIDFRYSCFSHANHQNKIIVIKAERHYAVLTGLEPSM